jgi:hypothetical protein
LKCPEHSDSEEVTIKSLEEYYNSLEDLLKKMCKNIMKQRSKKLLKPEYADFTNLPAF